MFVLILFPWLFSPCAGIYYAVLEEGGILLALTGTATGVVSAGTLLDKFPGGSGYRYFFSIIVALACVFWG